MSKCDSNRCDNCTNGEKEFRPIFRMERNFVSETIAIPRDDLYGPLSMRTGRPRHSPGRWSSTVVLPLAALLGTLTLTSCGSSATSGDHGGSTTDPSHSTSSTPAVPHEAVISAWLAAEEAFHQAALTSDSADPGLAATMVNPELSVVQSALSKLRAEGVIGRGPTFYGSPHVPSSTSSTATVVSCIHGEEVAVYEKTGAPIAGVLGQTDFELVTSTMRLTENGWKLAGQTVGVGECES